MMQAATQRSLLICVIVFAVLSVNLLLTYDEDSLPSKLTRRKHLNEKTQLPFRRVEKTDHHEVQQTALDTGDVDVLRKNPFCPGINIRYNPSDGNIMSSASRSWNSLDDITNENFTMYEVVDAKTTYRVCDEIEIRIHARNGRNESKGFGGDYFRVKVFTKNNTFRSSTASDGEVWDYGNGTYSAFVTLKWEGLVNIRVILVHSSEVVQVLDTQPRKRPVRFNYTSQYISRRNERIKEDVPCTFVPFANSEELCTVASEDTGSPWYCLRPRNKKLSCGDWLLNSPDLNVMRSKESSALTKTEDMAIAGTRQHLQISGYPMQLTVRSQLNGDIWEAIRHLPKCNIRSSLRTSAVSGFYHNDMWISPYCNNQRLFTKGDAMACLANKTEYFYGDSTIRQLYTYQMGYLPFDIRPRGRKWYHPVKITSTKYNVHANFAFHFLPGQIPGLNLSFLQPDKEFFDSINSEGDLVVIVSLWAHFTHLPIWYYQKRIQVILDAVDRLHQRNPRAIVMFKSGNTRQHEDWLRYIVASDWYARRQTRILRNMVASRPYVGFLDVWDTTMAQLVADNVHPSDPHTRNLFQMVMSIICH